MEIRAASTVQAETLFNEWLNGLILQDTNTRDWLHLAQERLDHFKCSNYETYANWGIFKKFVYDTMSWYCPLQRYTENWNKSICRFESHYRPKRGVVCFQGD